jgi:hypothetical protein
MSLGDILAAVVEGAATAARELVSAVPGAVRKVVTDPALREALDAGLRELGEHLEREIEEYERDPYAFFFDYMGAGQAWTARRVIERDGDRVLLAALADALDDDFVTRLVEAVGAAPYLHDAQRERLIAGLRALRDPGHHWTEPCDRLFGGLDGALWRAAEATGVVEEGQQHLVRHPRAQRITGLGGLLDPVYGLQVNPSFRRFVLIRLFGQGNDARHGRAEGGYRSYALLLAAAVAGWLATYGNSAPLRELVSRLDTSLERYIEALPDVPATTD